ncbi:MAG TPA: hypothetical protein VJM09_05050 [Sphingobium sp.]|nr:hypothetical protein [Sphingobium sp.]
MARLLLAAVSAALLASSASAAVLVVRSSGPSAASYPPGKALADNHVLKLKASDTVVLLDSRGTRTLSGPGNFNVTASTGAVSGAVRTAGTSARRVRLGAVRGAKARSVWQADIAQSGNVCIANPSELTLYRSDATKDATVTLTDSGGRTATVEFKAEQWDAAWPKAIPVASGAKVNVTGVGEPATLTLRQLTPIPTGLESMAQSLIRANCEGQLDALIETISPRLEG